MMFLRVPEQLTTTLMTTTTLLTLFRWLFSTRHLPVITSYAWGLKKKEEGVSMFFALAASESKLTPCTLTFRSSPLGTYL